MVPRLRRAAYASLSCLNVADLSTTMAMRQKLRVEEEAKRLDAVGDQLG